MTTDSVKVSQRILGVGKRALPFLAMLATLAPVALYGWLGQYLRPLNDDYYTLRIGRELGAWEGMLFHLRSWSGGYTNFLIKSAMAPLDTWAPAVTIWLLVAMWLTAALWLTRGLLPRFGIGRPHWKLQIIVAACIVIASIYSQYSRQVFYWHGAAIAYSMPVTILTMFLALLVGSPLRSATRRQMAGRASAGALLCFLSAGFSEIFVGLQTALLTLGLLLAPTLSRGKLRQNYLTLLGVGWLATLASLLIQSKSPGVALRLEAQSILHTMTVRDYLDWVAPALDLALFYVGHPPAVAGFVFLFCVGLSATLFCSRPRINLVRDTEYRISRTCLRAALIAQILLLPFLLAHQSDHPQVFGRFSLRYSLAIGTNVMLILLSAIGLWQWRRLRAARTRDRRIAWYSFCASLSAALLLFCSTQLGGIHWRASTFLQLNALLILTILAGQLLTWLRDKQLWWYLLLALVTTFAAWMLFNAVVFVAFVSLGFVEARLLASASSGMMLSGLVWGVCLGYLIKHWLHEIDSNRNRSSWLGICSAIVALIIGVSILSSQARLIPDFARFAREWDERHQTIIDQRDQGQRDIRVRPLSFNMHEFLGLFYDYDSRFRYAYDYYGVDAIFEADV